ncbi:LpxI family protein [bacterium]|nr:MAG: LpxI family protein [bacterium]
MYKIDQIAIIAGSGKFPLLIAKAAKSNNIRVIVLAIVSSAEKGIEQVCDKTYWVELGRGKKLIEILLKERIKYAVMAGKVNKSTIIRQSVRLDDEAKSILKRIKNKKDDTILSAVADRLEDFDVELIDSTLFLKNFMSGKGPLTKKRPSRKQQQDIQFGFSIAKNMGGLDIGQCVIIKDKAVIAVEAIEGTDEAIIRAGKLVGDGTVIVKVAKPSQDMRFDVPIVGLDTLKTIKLSGASVLALESGKVLMMEKEDMIQQADKMGICIIGV